MTSSAMLPHLPAIAPSYSGGSLISHPRKLRLRGATNLWVQTRAV